MPVASSLDLSRRAVAVLAASVGLCAMLALAVPGIAAAGDKEIAEALRAGGLVMVVRHGATFPDQADTDPLNFDNIAAQRNLNDKGKVLAKAFGDALRQVGVPIGTVYTSKYNRGYETAVVAGFKDIIKTPDLTEGGLVVSPNENNRRAAALRKMLTVMPKAGINTVLITHLPNIIAALGKDCSTWRKARPRFSVRRMARTSSSLAYRWVNGPALPTRQPSSDVARGSSCHDRT